jgi:hypothetical protein
MRPSTLLDTILSMLRAIKDNPAKLQKLHDFMVNEIYEEEEEDDETLQVPEKYRTVVTEAAEWLAAGMICFINPEALELVTIPSSVLDEIGWDEEEEMQEENDLNDYADFRKDMKRINAEWNKVVRIEQPHSNESFRFMESFVNTLSDAKLRQSLSNALQRSKPFKNFNTIVHNSTAREAWFAFKQKCLEEYVFDEIRTKVNDDAESQ